MSADSESGDRGIIPDTDDKHRLFEQLLSCKTDREIRRMMDEAYRIYRNTSNEDEQRAVSALLRIARNRGLV